MTNGGIIKDLITSRSLILGAIGFATGVATFLIQVLHWDPVCTVAEVSAITLCVCYVGLLIHRSENRYNEALKARDDELSHKVQDIRESINKLNDIMTETRRDTLRIQLRDYIKNEPHNMDTILSLASAYFVGMDGNWVETNSFLKWAKQEGVEIPRSIFAAIKRHEEDPYG